MKPTTRRAHLKQITFSTAAMVLPVVFRSASALALPDETQPTPTQSEAGKLAEIAQAVMTQNQAPGLSVAIARRGQFVYRQAFGVADQASGAAVTTSSLFRIASISKPITSVAIFTLVEAGRLRLEDLVFGPQGILKFDYGENLPELVKKITVHHLLTHTCGGWDNHGADPMFARPAMNHRELITWTLREQPLQNEPGTHYSYSNFGYCLLGRVIEKITGMDYAAYVQKNVLAPAGINDMRIGGNTLAQRASNEVCYYGQAGAGTNPYDMNLTRMDSHGGWIATPADLVQFALQVDGFATSPKLLRPETLKTMTTASAANANYACGWCVNKVPNWWHDGSLPGTLTIMVRTASGLCWAAFTNTRANGLNLDEMMWKMVKAVPAWRA